jgi:hypothetical protein
MCMEKYGSVIAHCLGGYKVFHLTERCTLAPIFQLASQTELNFFDIQAAEGGKFGGYGPAFHAYPTLELALLLAAEVLENIRWSTTFCNQLIIRRVILYGNLYRGELMGRPVFAGSQIAVAKCGVHTGNMRFNVFADAEVLCKATEYDAVDLVKYYYEVANVPS